MMKTVSGGAPQRYLDQPPLRHLQWRSQPPPLVKSQVFLFLMRIKFNEYVRLDNERECSMGYSVPSKDRMPRGRFVLTVLEHGHTHEEFRFCVQIVFLHFNFLVLTLNKSPEFASKMATEDSSQCFVTKSPGWTLMRFYRQRISLLPGIFEKWPPF